MCPHPANARLTAAKIAACKTFLIYNSYTPAPPWRGKY